MKKPLVIIDTNVFISGLIVPSGHPYKIIQLWQKSRIELALSDELLNEIINVLNRKKIKTRYHLTNTSVHKLIELLQQRGKKIVLKSNELRVRDPKDQFLLDLALSAKADFLISGDRDLLVLASEPSLKKLRIISPKAFLETVASEGELI
ncbi:MAG: putative toxin-antitoxin system toxin component, PIN family [Candidatus Pacebacteria bacterium]|nr:putative toxin-antitoxin system toxin component, PIN family [Candidatus Paceibacterota bacterium]PIR59711.1 MAG: putative toxin-antitoxin system toxin component, PIN family [Candidatus Pacebacteria bacterium CG10_big_fil_rev_8_21_14_0_10_45_6]